MRGMILVVIGSVLAASLQAALAQSKNELIKSLLPMRSPTRSIAVESSKEAAAGGQELPKINLTIAFESGSDRLTPAGRKQLDALGAALQDPGLKSFRFLIAGHTDGAGTERHNQQLSERRAAAVKAYLVGNSGVEETRLATVGLGKSKPLDAANPLSAANRRVEIINLLN
jgi:outer membrane protein OmpA-like peptidoglycan-associated protein